MTRYESYYALSNTTDHSYPSFGISNSKIILAPIDDIYDTIVDMFTGAGLGVPVITVANSTDNMKRGSDNNLQRTLHWRTSLGTHTAMHLNHYDVLEMSNDIVNQHKSGYNGVSSGTGYFDRSMGRQIIPRTERYSVDWVSYNVDNENVSLERNAWLTTRDPGVWDEEVANALYTNDLDSTWKWCITIMNSDNSDYNSFGEVDATHGEAYTNQYGGVDNYCNDNKGGAQCTTDGCQ
ncbi:hypothetical protein TPHA_0B04940 [Tetrapisispora phaffii CBS 4417]|uniref:Uncharacterized protein n=1 Tax=Tetrapisispora phaffii (strain ATCC 24235 / CBS 4417 / NBRC 1672 / NRRL Y-8282 / UCD 70-5) TaxID=1071381 RepID=G8BQ85_TETPH|nr:hypothetical protein TPHA_0B04940 [Tetrapisispora phaffii CBS 4417]CCE62166.1 hypothetical protein TPHA_0B04940 [Tetrapisispora phaffii CBS 4417]